MKSPILALTHARADKVVVCSLFLSYRPYINTHDVCGLYDKLITAMRAVEMRDAKKCANKIRQQMFCFLGFNTRIVSVMYTD